MVSSVHDAEIQELFKTMGPEALLRGNEHQVFAGMMTGIGLVICKQQAYNSQSKLLIGSRYELHRVLIEGL